MSLSQYFRLIDVQARMLLKADSSRFKLGYLWWFLEPLLWVGVFYVVFNLILGSSGRSGGDSLLFLICGKFAFIWFSKTVNQASNSIVANKGLVGKINVTKTIFPMAVVQESLYRQSAVYLLLLFLVIAFGGAPSLTWLHIVGKDIENVRLVASGAGAAGMACLLLHARRLFFDRCLSCVPGAGF